MFFCMLAFTITFSSSVKAYADLTVDTIIQPGFGNPSGVAVDSDGNVYITDKENREIKKWDKASGSISTVVSPSDGVYDPNGIALDSDGNLYVTDISSDNNGYTIKKWDKTSGKISTIVSKEQCSPELTMPMAVAVDSDGNLYFTNGFWGKIVKWDKQNNNVTNIIETLDDTVAVAVDSEGNVYTADGDNKVERWDVNTKTSSTIVDGLSYVGGIATDSTGNVYISDARNNAIKKWYKDTNKVETIVSTGLDNPVGVAVDSTGKLYIADQINQQIKEWDETSGLHTLITSTGLKNPIGVASDAMGNVLYIANGNSDDVRKLDKASGSITTIETSGFSNPSGVAVDGEGTPYVADTGNNQICVMDKEGRWAAPIDNCPDVDQPKAIAADSTGNLYIADTGHNQIKIWDKQRKNSKTIVSDGLNNPSGVAVDNAGNVYIADTGNNAIKKWDKVSEKVETIVPNESGGLKNPTGVVVDSIGNVYVADTGNNVIKKWDKASGIVTTVVSSGLVNPNGLSLDSTGNMYIADTGSIKIKKISASAAPIADNAGSAVLIGKKVSLSTVTAGADIYYTEDGSIPTTLSTHYTEPITVSSAETIKAIAVKDGMLDSNVMSESYTIIPAAMPTASPAGGAVVSGTQVSLNSATAGADIYYTEDGNPPTTSSTKYTEPITVSSEETIKAIAVKSDMADSEVMSESYTLKAAAPTASSAGGAVLSGTKVALSSATTGAAIYYTEDGNPPTTSSTKYTEPITVSSAETIKAIAVKSDMADSEVMSESYTIMEHVAMPTANPARGAVASGTKVSLSSSTTGAIIHYTTDGSTPTTGSAIYTGPITVSSAETIKAIAVKGGMVDSSVMSESYTIAAPYIPPYVPPYTPPTPQPTTETREVPVVVDNGGTNTNAAQVPVTRTTDSDGIKIDTVKFDEDKAKETVTKALETKTDTATISVTDIPGNNADKVEVQVPQSSMTQLGSNNIGLDVKTEKAALELPKETVSGLKDKDAKIQISEVKDSNKVEETKGLILKLASGSEVIAAPLKIETNFTGKTKITLPIDASKLPSSKEELDKFLSSLAVMVQHSDGENAIDKGTITYDEKGKAIGISIWVDKFSDFTLISLPESYFQGRTTVMKDKVVADKEWQIKFTKTADSSTITKDNVYVTDLKGNRVEVEVSYGSDNILKVTPVNPYKSGETYYLYISKNVKSRDKTALVNELRYQFTIK